MEKNYSAYKDYKSSDFLADESFKSWVINSGNRLPENNKWLEVRAQYPHLIPAMDAARSTIVSIRGSLKVPGEGRVGAWAAIEQRVVPVRNPARRSLGIGWAAAVVCLFALGSLYFIKLHQPMVTLATAYGEQQEIDLPDGSRVTLYPHSTIRYLKNWKSGSYREIWVEGDAHLSVVKIKQPTQHEGKNIPFEVHLGDSLSVMVMGTEFAVYNREKQAAAVYLESGLVQVCLPGQNVQLLPGESVVYRQGEGLVKQAGPLAISRIGQAGELSLENARVDETVRYIASTFGASVHVAVPFRHRRLDGVIPFTSAEEALQVLADILDGRLVEQPQGNFQVLEK